jgi:hypothetical protein
MANGCRFVVKNLFAVGMIPTRKNSDNPRTEAYDQWVKP